MNWKDRMENYGQESDRKTEEARRQLETLATEKQKKEAILIADKSPELFATLERFNVEETLTSIRNDLWKLGDIRKEAFFVDETNDYPNQGDSPDDGWNRPDYNPFHSFKSSSNIVATISLVAEWPVFFPAYSKFWGGGTENSPSGVTHIPEGIGTVREHLIVAAYHGESDYAERHKYTGHNQKPERGVTIVKLQVNTNMSLMPYYTSYGLTSNENIDTITSSAELELEGRLVQDSRTRLGIEGNNVLRARLPYDQARKEAEAEILRHFPNWTPSK